MAVIYPNSTSMPYEEYKGFRISYLLKRDVDEDYLVVKVTYKDKKAIAFRRSFDLRSMSNIYKDISTAIKSLIDLIEEVKQEELTTQLIREDVIRQSLFTPKQSGVRFSSDQEIDDWLSEVDQDQEAEQEIDQVPEESSTENNSSSDLVDDWLSEVDINRYLENK